MNPDLRFRRTDYYKRHITVMFLAVFSVFILFIGGYWSLMLEPQLKARAGVTARAVVMSNLGPLQRIAVMPPSEAGLAIRVAPGKLLILEDPESGVSFVSGLALSLDPEVTGLAPGNCSVVLGNTLPGKKTAMDIPLYTPQSRELFGVLNVWVNPDYISRFIRRIKRTFFFGACLGMLLITVAWIVSVRMLIRTKKAEMLIEEKKAQLIHAGRLTAMGEMATGIAHELNQPLSIIRIAADGLNAWFSGQSGDGSMERNAAESILVQVDRAREIIDHMRAFARTGTEGVKTVSISEPIEKAASFFRQQFKHHGIHLNISLQNREQCVSVHPEKFEQIIVNLLSNARFAVDDHDGDGREKNIEIKVFKDEAGNRTVCEVTDNGRGMNELEKERCLEPFYTTKNVGEGTGLGLSIVHSIVRDSGMGLEIESRKGQGSTFRLLIPFDHVKNVENNTG